jgi:hypothetical protein
MYNYYDIMSGAEALKPMTEADKQLLSKLSLAEESSKALELLKAGDYERARSAGNKAVLTGILALVGSSPTKHYDLAYAYALKSAAVVMLYDKASGSSKDSYLGEMNQVGQEAIAYVGQGTFTTALQVVAEKFPPIKQVSEKLVQEVLWSTVYKPIALGLVMVLALVGGLYYYKHRKG